MLHFVRGGEQVHAEHGQHATAGEPVASLRGITKVYRPTPPAMRALVRTTDLRGRCGTNGVDLDVGAGQTVAVVGPNGAGKTTIFRILTGLTTPTTGTVRVLGLDADRQSLDVRRVVGFMPAEDRSLFMRMTCLENLRFHARLQRIPRRELLSRCRAMLDEVGLAGRAKSSVFALSAGMRARLQLARALLHRPRLVILDEPTGAVDPVGAHELLELVQRMVREHNLAALISSHRLEEIEALGSNVVLLDKGRIRYQGNLDGLRARWQRPFVELVMPSTTLAVKAPWLCVTAEPMLSFMASGWSATCHLVRRPETLCGRLARLRSSWSMSGRPRHLCATSSPRSTQARGWRSRRSGEHEQSRSRTKRVGRGCRVLPAGRGGRLSYPMSLGFRFLAPVVSIALYYFQAQFLGRPESYSATIVGVSVALALQMALTGFGNRLQSVQDRGNFEPILIEPVPWFVVPMTMNVWLSLTGVVTMGFMLTAGVLLGADINASGLPAFAMILFLGILACNGIGVLSASLLVLAKKSNAILGLYGLAASLLGGALFSIEVLPDWLRPFSYLVPHSYVISASRDMLVPGGVGAGMPLSTAIIGLVCFNLLIFPVGMYTFSRALEYARRTGLIGGY